MSDHDTRKTRLDEAEDEGAATPVDLGDIEQYETAEEAQARVDREGPRAAEAPAQEAGDRPPTAEEYEALKAERNRLYEVWLRTSADFDNYRKRTEREREEFRQYAMEALLFQMLPVLDNFERALGSLPPDLPRGFAEGVTLIYKQLQDVLAKQGLTPLDTEKAMFDPHVHEAVETEARRDLPHHQIIGEVQRGYKLGKRVLRPALVKVCVHPEEEASLPIEDEPDSAGGGQ